MWRNWTKREKNVLAVFSVKIWTQTNILSLADGFNKVNNSLSSFGKKKIKIRQVYAHLRVGDANGGSR